MIITSQDLVRDIADSWKKQYFVDDAWRFGAGKEEVYNKLVALGSNAKPSDVDAAIGNDSWTALWCHECCERHVSFVFAFAMSSRIELPRSNIGLKIRNQRANYYYFVCENCLVAALRGIEQRKDQAIRDNSI